MELTPKVDLFSKFLHEFQHETDRGASILAGSMLDQKLKDILFDFLIDGAPTKDLLNGNNAPLGTFSSRLNLAYSLGLISEYEYHDCNIIRKIRNDFAHKFELEFSFTDQKVSALCWNLKADTPGDKENFKGKPRQLFNNGVTVLYVNLLYREEHVRKIKLTRPNWYDITWGLK
jgi:mannitol operon repressor